MEEKTSEDYYEEHYIFILSKYNGKKYYYNNVDYTRKAIEALLQFEVAPSNYVGIKSPRLSEGYRKIFDSSVFVNKHKSTLLNHWFLHLNNKKYCSKCKCIYSIKSFGKDNSRWNSLAVFCKACINTESNNWKRDNPDKVYETNKRWKAKNPEKVKSYRTKHRLANLHKDAAKSALRRASKQRATPKWLSEEQKKEIISLYYLAKKLTKENNIVYHVDHIVPLNGTNICGLHVPWNLQVITAVENMKNGNKYDYWA